LGVYRFEPAPGPTGDKRIRYGLGAVKGTGQGAIEAIIRARSEGGPFSSIFDFAARIDRKSINKRAVDALIKAGAFDKIHPKGIESRAELLASLSLAFEYADTQAAHADQGGLFDFGSADDHGSSTREPDYVATPAWDVKTRLTHEKVALGYYFSGHLFDQVAAEVRQFAKRAVADVIDTREPQMLAGIITDLRIVNGQRGKVALFKLDDHSGTIESVINEDLLNSASQLLKDDELIVAQGRAQPDRFSGGWRFNINQVWSLADARCRHGQYLRLSLGTEATPPPFDLILRDHPAKHQISDQGEVVQGLAIRVTVRRPTAMAELDLGGASRFYPSDSALALWSQWAQQGGESAQLITLAARIPCILDTLGNKSAWAEVGVLAPPTVMGLGFNLKEFLCITVSPSSAPHWSLWPGFPTFGLPPMWASRCRSINPVSMAASTSATPHAPP
jgi:DNA polymerase-3 subunit alpha